ncbi:N-acetyltransferase DgcN [Kiloniella sp. b19]|uniref:N-acetyltransferase DgcN n=1 Tax=Kiloniella sp. GXU_MW_B19 TaxID=3141326 RepID=UPI0031D6A35E
MELKTPYLLFLGDVPDALAAKTAIGIVEWRPEWCVGQFRMEGCGADCGIDDLSIEEAVTRGCKTMVIGVVNAGGVLPDHWIDNIVRALDAGLDVASGLHMRLEDNARIREAAERSGAQLHNVRHSNRKWATGKGTKRRGKRVLAVGTDCSVGKKYTALALEREMRGLGMDADFRATGQTGVFISGRGAAIDAVVADFIAGAAEWISPAAESDDHWDVIEGQGSLFHPSFAGVSLGLLHGSQPDALVICHEPTRKTMRGVETLLPSIQEVIDLNLACGRLNNPDIRCVGLAVNTQALEENEAKGYLAKLTAEYGLPATDPVRFGMREIAQRLKDGF